MLSDPFNRYFKDFQINQTGTAAPPRRKPEISYIVSRNDSFFMHHTGLSIELLSEYFCVWNKAPEYLTSEFIMRRFILAAHVNGSEPEE